MYFAKQLWDPSNDVLKSDAAENKTKRQLLKQVLTFVSVLHISEIFKTHEIVCGSFGAVAALIDVYELYPRVK